MWPYGYTYDEHPERHDDAPTTTRSSTWAGRWRAPTATGRSRRATCTSRSGTTRDYAYGTYRIFSYTFEMSNGDYLDDSQDRLGDRPEQERRAVPGGARLVSAHACSATTYVHVALRRVRRRPRGRRAAGRRTRTAPIRRTSGAFARGNPDRRPRRAGAKQLGDGPVGIAGAGDRPRPPARRPTPTTSTGGRPSGQPPIKLSDDDRPAAVLPLRVRPRLERRRRPTGWSRASRRRAAPGRRSSR